MDDGPRPWKIQSCCNNLNFDLVVRFEQSHRKFPDSATLPWNIQNYVAFWCILDNLWVSCRWLCSYTSSLKSLHLSRSSCFQGCIPWFGVHNAMHDDRWTMDDVSTLDIVSTCTLRTCGWATRKHGSGHRRFLEGVFLKCSLRGCIMKTEPSHSSPSSPFSTSFYINLDPPWEHRLKMVEENVHRTSCSSSHTFPSFRFIRRMRWWSRMNSHKVQSIFYSSFYRPCTLQTVHPTRQSTFWIFQDDAGDSRWAQIRTATGSNVFQCVCSMFVPLDVLWTFWGVRRNI